MFFFFLYCDSVRSVAGPPGDDGVRRVWTYNHYLFCDDVMMTKWLTRLMHDIAAEGSLREKVAVAAEVELAASEAVQAVHQNSTTLTEEKRREEKSEV